MGNRNIKLGRLGEDIAKKFLEEKGYKIIGRNYKNKYGEIDLIALKENTLTFVEVKTRLSEQFGLPENAINNNKIKKLKNNAAAYMAFKEKEIKSYTIDAVCIVLNEDYSLKKINHYKNITI